MKEKMYCNEMKYHNGVGRWEAKTISGGTLAKGWEGQVHNG